MPMKPIPEANSYSAWAYAKTFAMIAGMAAMMLMAGIAVHLWWTASAATPGVRFSLFTGFNQLAPFYGFTFLLVTGLSGMLTHAMVKCSVAESRFAFERRFRETLGGIGLMTLGLDAQGRISFCNDVFQRLVGQESDEVVGRDWIDAFVPADARAETTEAFLQAASGSAPHKHYQCKIRARSGREHVISWGVWTLHDPLQKTVGYTCIGQDITEADEMKEQLRKLSHAVEQSPSVVMIVNLEGKIEYVNPKFTKLTGYTLDELRGKNPRVLKSGETSADEYKTLWSTVSAGGEWRGVFHNRKKSGELYWEAAVISGLRDADGVITHFIAVKEDITERVRLEQEVAERNREIAKNQTLAAIGQVATMLAHDLRNPLSSVKMGLQMLSGKPSHQWGEAEQELQQIALQQLQFTEEILQNLLSYSRPDALRLEWLNIGKLLDVAVFIAHREIDGRPVRIATRHRHGLPTLYGDPGKLKQAFSNIINNAVEATKDIVGRTPEVVISTDVEVIDEAPWIQVEISDNGVGIEAATSERVFEPFFTTRAKGTGLGLAIVKRIVDQHRGSVSIRPGAPYGTIVRVVLPTTAVLEDAEPGAPTDDRASLRHDRAAGVSAGR